MQKFDPGCFFENILNSSRRDIFVYLKNNLLVAQNKCIDITVFVHHNNNYQLLSNWNVNQEKKFILKTGDIESFSSNPQKFLVMCLNKSAKKIIRKSRRASWLPQQTFHPQSGIHKDKFSADIFITNMS